MSIQSRLTAFASISALLLCASSAFAQKAFTINQAPRSIKPLRMAKVNSHGQLIGPWIKTSRQGADSALSVAFDCFEADATGQPTELPAYGPTINVPPALPGSRYYNGPTAQNMFCANDMTVANGMAGALATRADLAWYWNGTAGEHCFLVVNTAEDFGGTNAGPSFDNVYDGVVYDFGTTLAPGFYISRADLTGTLNHKMPVDGQGAYILTIANAVSETGITLASTAQPMLWVTKINNPSFQGEFQWDDDNPINGMHDAPDEFYSYLVPQISDRPLGAMIAFYAEPASSSPFNPSSYTIQNGTFLSGTVASLTADDSNYLRVRQSPFGARIDPVVRVTYSGTAPVASGSSVTAKVTVKTDAAPPGNVNLVVELWNFNTSSWVQVASGPATTANNTLQGTTASGAGFVAPTTNEVRCRLSAFTTGAIQTRSWSVDTDSVTLTVNP